MAASSGLWKTLNRACKPSRSRRQLFNDGRDNLCLNGKLIEVREAFLQCAKALIRSRLWGDEYRLSKDRMPTLGKILVDQIGLTTPVSELEAMIEKAYCEKLY